MTEKYFDYTDEARAELDVALEEFAGAIEKVLSDEKFVPGELDITVTAADVRRAVGKIEIVDRKRRELRRLAVKTYAAMGIGIFFAGVAYPWLTQFVMDPVQISLIATGILMFSAALIIGYWIDARRSGVQSSIEHRNQQIINDLLKELRQQNLERLHEQTSIILRSHIEGLEAEPQLSDENPAGNDVSTKSSSP